MLSRSLRVARRWADIARTSRPSRKPQLWEDLPFYIRRRLAYTAATVLAPTSLDRPRLVRLRSNGVLIEVLPRRYVGQSIFLYGVWEIVGTRLLELLLRPGMRFIDIGANVGEFAKFMRRSFPVARIVAFEPLPGPLQALRRLADTDDLITVVPCAYLGLAPEPRRRDGYHRPASAPGQRT